MRDDHQVGAMARIEDRLSTVEEELDRVTHLARHQLTLSSGHGRIDGKCRCGWHGAGVTNDDVAGLHRAHRAAFL